MIFTEMIENNVLEHSVELLLSDRVKEVGKNAWPNFNRARSFCQFLPTNRLSTYETPAGTQNLYHIYYIKIYRK